MRQIPTPPPTSTRCPVRRWPAALFLLAAWGLTRSAGGAQAPGEAQPDPWRKPAAGVAVLSPEAEGVWKVESRGESEFDLTSSLELPARSAQTFQIRLRVRVDLHTRALPDLACYDAAGRTVPGRSVLATGPDVTTTEWQELRRVFPTLPGTARVRARVRARGKGVFRLAELGLRPVETDAYQTGALYTPLYPRLRRGLILESNLGIVNEDLVSAADRDGDEKWARIAVDLDALSQTESRGSDWRTRFEYRPNEIYWSDGVVLKSDTVGADREPDPARALHFRMAVHPGPYRVRLSDPGRAVAVSLDGRAWKHYPGGTEPDLGLLPMRDGVLELWVDACRRDPIYPGPVYFDYLRLYPADDPAQVERLVAAARPDPRAAGRAGAGAGRERRVPIHFSAARFVGGARWPIRCGLPIPRGELPDARQAGVWDTAGRQVPAQVQSLATWDDGSVRWLFLDFQHDLARDAEGRAEVRYGPAVEPAPIAGGVRVRQEASGLAVNTGALHFRVSRARFGLLEDVRCADGAVAQSRPVSLEIEEPNGRRWRALDLPVARLEVEQPGPLHTVILAETRAAAPGGPTTGFRFRTRLHVYAGSPLVQADVFVANTDSRPEVRIRSCALHFQPEGRGASAGRVVQATAAETVPSWASSGGTTRFAVGVEAMREQFPKALRWTPASLRVGLWAPEGGELAWIQGVGKTHRLALFYGQSGEEGTLLSQGPVLARADPEWYAGSGAFGSLETAAQSPFPAVERTLAAHMADAVVNKIGLGFENYGDHSSSGYVAGAYLWDNNEYDLPAGALVHFARTGDPGALRAGLAGAQHFLDVDTIHYSFRHPDWVGAAHTHSHGETGHHTADAPNMHHAGYVRGLIWHSYLTGEPGGILGARGIADWVLRNMAPEANVGQMERAMGLPLMTLNDVYDATGEERYLRGAARLATWALRWEHPLRGGFLAPITEQPAYYSGAPFCGGLLPGALLHFNTRARSPEIEALLERIARWTLTDMWRPPGRIMSKGGSPRRGADAQHIATHLPLLRHCWEKTGDPLFLVAPRAALVGGFGERARPFGTRATGLVFNHLPVFLPLLRGWDEPAPGRGLRVAPGNQDLLVNPGSSFGVRIRLHNPTSEPITRLRAGFQARPDFQTAGAPPSPAHLAPGETVTLEYSVRAPSRINLTCEHNTQSYAQWCASYEQGGAHRLARAWARITLVEARSEQGNR